MRKIYLIAAFSLLFFSSYSQQLSQVTYSGGTTFSWFSLSTNQNVLIRISDDGKILEYGIEEQSLYNKNYYAQKLQPYQGRIDYYSNESDSAFRGKIKSIGTCFFTYYSSKDYPEKVGKIQMAGSLSFDYYRKYDDALIAGKIKSIGSSTIAYYTSFDNEALKGKPKLIGSTAIAYYTSFDDVAIRGKLKSIGSAQYIWYTSYDRKEFSGGLKSGVQRQAINGVTYIIQ
jgi:hypothetical protein